MKKVEIITRPFYLDEIKDTLSSIGIDDIIASDIRVSGGQSNSDTYLQEDYFVEFMPKIKIEFFVELEDIAKITKAIKEVAEQDVEQETSMYIRDIEKLI